MAEKEYFEDDRMIVPEWINKLTPDELDAEIERLEKEEAQKKAKILIQRENPA